jgi:hypothetical protein
MQVPKQSANNQIEDVAKTVITAVIAKMVEAKFDRDRLHNTFSKTKHRKMLGETNLLPTSSVKNLSRNLLGMSSAINSNTQVVPPTSLPITASNKFNSPPAPHLTENSSLNSLGTNKGN